MINLNKLKNFKSKIERRIRNKIIRLKSKVNDFFLMNYSLNHLIKLMEKLYVISIDFDDIYYGFKNPRRFIICVLICAYVWLTTFQLSLFCVSDYLYSLIDNPFLPQFYRTFMLLGVISLIMINVNKTDLLLGEISHNLSPFKIFYYLMNDIKSKHKLNYKNYKKLGILLRFLQISMIDYGSTIMFFGTFLFMLKISILSRNLFWIYSILISMTPTFLFCTFSVNCFNCILIITFTYYKMLFDQINDQIKLISKENLLLLKKKNINKVQRNDRQLIELINQHNQTSIEIYKINMTFRRTAASIFISYTFIKIISLYLVMNLNNILIKIITVNAFVLAFICGFGISFLFSQQINSAKKSYNFIHSIICSHKMHLPIKFKVCQ